MNVLMEWWPLAVSMVALIAWIVSLRKDLDATRDELRREVVASTANLIRHEKDCDRRYQALTESVSEIRAVQERNRGDLHSKLDELMRVMITRGGS